jgi:hypothetical protein
MDPNVSNVDPTQGNEDLHQVMVPPRHRTWNGSPPDLGLDELIVYKSWVCTNGGRLDCPELIIDR